MTEQLFFIIKYCNTKQKKTKFIMGGVVKLLNACRYNRYNLD